MTKKMNWIQYGESKTTGEVIAWGKGYSSAMVNIMEGGYDPPFDDFMVYRQRDLAKAIDRAILEARIEEVERAVALMYSDGIKAYEALQDKLMALKQVQGTGKSVATAAAPDSDTKPKHVEEHLADRGIFTVRAPK